MPHLEANFLQLQLRHLTGSIGANLRRSNYFVPRKGGKGIIYSSPSILYALYICHSMVLIPLWLRKQSLHFIGKYNNEVEMTWALESNMPPFKIWTSLLIVLRNTFKFFQSVSSLIRQGNILPFIVNEQLLLLLCFTVSCH